MMNGDDKDGGKAMMSEWSEVFKTSGLKEMVVKDGVTGRVLYYGKKGVSC